MTAAIRIALLNVRLVMRTKVALFFTFLFPLVFLFVYAGLFARGNPQAVAYMFGPVVTLNIMGSGFWGLGLQSVVQRERGSLRRFRLAPIGPGSIVLSSLFANYLLQLPTLALLVFCARVIFHMPFNIGLFTFLTLATVGVFAFAGFGLIIASVPNTMQEAQIYNNLAWLTLLFLSGTTVPLPMLPGWIQSVATFLPATYLVSAFQAVMIQSQPLLHHWPEMLALLASGVFGLLFAWKLFRWEKDERIPARRKWWTAGFVLPFLLVGFWMNAFANPRASWTRSYSLIGRQEVPAERLASSAPWMILEDFEKAGAAEDLLHRWELTATFAGGDSSVADISVVSPGAAGTQHALRLSGHSGSSEALSEVTARFRFVPPTEAQDSQGIELWLRGNAPVSQVNVYPTGERPELHSAVRLAPGADWLLVRVPVRWETQPGSNDSPWILEIVTSVPAGEFAVEADEITLY